ncbi:MAG: hypothetical protein M1822_005982 [Bathelium mastoideum]|nr:MAG: hypothetical protein M1822_005982 [Bathelium mastoideum]
MDTTSLVRRRTTELAEEKSGQNPSGQSHTNSGALLRVDQIYSRKDRQTHFVKTAKSGLSSAKNDRFNKTTLVIRRIISSKGMVAATEVDIKAPPLADLLRQIFHGLDGLKLNKSPPVADPQLLFHAYPELDRALQEEKAKDEPSRQLVSNISTALTFVHEDFGSDIESLATLSEHGEITFDLLWSLFPPRVKVFTQGNKLQEPQVMDFQLGEYKRLPDGTDIYELDVKIISHDGVDFGYGAMTQTIRGFPGAKKVTSLPIYPLKYHPDVQTITQKLIARGRKYVSMLKPICQEYIGAGIDEEVVAGQLSESLFPVCTVTLTGGTALTNFNRLLVG